MNTIDCPKQGCTWQYKSNLSQDQSILEIIQIHIKLEHSQVTQTEGTMKPTKMNPPTIDIGVDQEEWNTFTVRWRQYCNGVHLNEGMRSLQLFNCASEKLGNLLLKFNPNITDLSADVVMKTIESFAVIHSATSVIREELRRMTQGNDESIVSFAARVRGKAETCEFVTKSKCRCGCDVEQEVYYTEQAITEVVLAGISDKEIQTSVHEIEGIQRRSVNEIVSLIQRKERSRRNYRAADVSAVSAFKRQQTQPESAPAWRSNTPPAQSPTVPCPGCNKSFRKFTGRNHKSYKQCRDCFLGRRSRGNKTRSMVNASDANDPCMALTQEFSTVTTTDSTQ